MAGSDPLTMYADDDDLKVYRADILDFGVTSWADQHKKAFTEINRALDVGWYRQNAAVRGLYTGGYIGGTLADRIQNYGSNMTVYPFDAELLLNAETQLRKLACFKCLELAYALLTKGDDSFSKLRDHYKAEYEKEMVEVMAAGIDYDWDESGIVDDTEKATVKEPRRLVRC